jgi:hypothetical protein
MLINKGEFILENWRWYRILRRKNNELVNDRGLKVDDPIKYAVISFFALVIMLSGFIFNTPTEILLGLGAIIQSPSILITDYMVVGNIGASFLNAGLLMLLTIALSYRNNVHMNGPIIAAAFTIMGFAFFGKNLYNVLPIIFGVYIRGRYQKTVLGKLLLPALFGTALGPLVSQVSFGFDFPLYASIPLGVAFGILVGFILPPLANHFIPFHQGFNLYNIGFTAGMIGMLMMGLFRSFNLETPIVLRVQDGYNAPFLIYFSIFFFIMLVLGLLFNRFQKSSYQKLLQHSGRLVTDFVFLNGFGVSLINMALLGFLSLGYILLVGGEINGPTIGGIFTVVGFGAFGKHINNVWPILVGVFLSSLLKVWDVSSTGAILAALFGTTLAPIAGAYGPIYGIVAGFVHMSMVMNVGALHGGMNLYNNGFSGGFVAALLVPIFDSLNRKKRRQKNDT